MHEVRGYEIATIVFCLIASGFYSGSESVLLSVGVDRARRIIDEGGPSAKTMRFMIDKPSELLTTILVGNNLVNILLSTMITVVTTRYFGSTHLGIAVGISTIAILLFGEIIPKTFGMANAERISVPAIKFLQLNYYTLFPIVHIMSWLTKKLLGESAIIRAKLITKRDLEYMVSKAGREKTIDSKQLDMLSNILEFPTIKVKDIMIPRQEIKYVQADWKYDELLDYVKLNVHSRFPVCEENLDRCIGFLHTKALLALEENLMANFTAKDIVKDPFFVFENMKIQMVFEAMNRKKLHLALVKDESGLVVGVITIEDIIEEILGEIHDEYDLDEEDLVLEKGQKGILVPGTLSIRDLASEYDIELPSSPNYSTLSGFLLEMIGNNFPKKGQIIVFGNHIFEIYKVENYFIEKVRIRNIVGEPSNEEPPKSE
jgi:CBS domain containing-hemolysin-like protein